ncbi:MAG: ribosome maturation factor RimP [Bacillota bacterium]
MDREQTVALVKELSEKVASGTSIEIVQVDFRRERSEWVLEILIDCPEGVSLDHCEFINRKVSERLDELDPIQQAYVLEVASPGADRPLVRADDFRRFAGERIKVATHQGLEGRKHWTGKLLGLQGDQVIMEVDGQEVRLDLNNIRRANIVPAFDR